MKKIFGAVAAVLPMWAGSGIDIRTASLPTAVVNHPYTPPALAVIGGGGCVPNNLSLSLAAGRLPEGIDLSPAGFFSGTPVREGVFAFTVRVANDCAAVEREFLLRVEGPALLRLDPRELVFCYRSGDPPPAPQTVQVSGTWPAQAYRIEPVDAPWLAARPLRGRTPPEGSAMRHDPVEVSVDGSGLRPGEYRGWLRVEAWEADNAPRIPVVLRVSAPVLVEIDRPSKRTGDIH
ncbi:MAG: putative Ig domain-containing protein [Bryobacteraceae bacterium]|nr:putative Ig domain-containing protein [Bryobacteraceae bacterium]